MKRTHIKAKLKELGVNPDEISLGLYDYLGEYTAKKTRQQGTENFNKFGCFFRPNYERGILIYNLIVQNNLDSFLEIGFGRGYGALCALMAFQDLGKLNDCVVTSIDPAFADTKLIQHLHQLNNIFPSDWLAKLEMVPAKSQDFLKTSTREYDFIYIDGEHTYEAVKTDWELCRDKYKKYLLFDDYIANGENAQLAINKVVDEIEDPSKELLIMDRRIFFDDRMIVDGDINYGQILLTKD